MSCETVEFCPKCNALAEEVLRMKNKRISDLESEQDRLREALGEVVSAYAEVPTGSKAFSDVMAAARAALEK